MTTATPPTINRATTSRSVGSATHKQFLLACLGQLAPERTTTRQEKQELSLNNHSSHKSNQSESITMESQPILPDRRRAEQQITYLKKKELEAKEMSKMTLEYTGKPYLLKAQHSAFNISDSTTIALTVQNLQITSFVPDSTEMGSLCGNNKNSRKLSTEKSGAMGHPLCVFEVLDVFYFFFSFWTRFWDPSVLNLHSSSCWTNEQKIRLYASKKNYTL